MATKIEILESELGAKITAVTVSYDRKISDGNYGSVGSFMSMTTELAPDADAEQVASALYEIVRESAEENFKPAFKDVTQPSWRREAALRETKTERDKMEEPIYTGMEDGPIEDAF